MSQKKNKKNIINIFLLVAFLVASFCIIGKKHAKDVPFTEKQVLQTLANFNRKLAKSPNIFFFITNRKKEKVIRSAKLPFLSLNNTRYFARSMFSLFHAENPEYLKYRDTSHWTTGSMPLRLLVKLGYKIHTLSNLLFYQENLEELIFGKDHHLTETFAPFPDGEMLFHAFKASLHEKTKSHQKNCYTIFLDAKENHLVEKFIRELKRERIFEDSIIVELLDLDTGSETQKLTIKLGSFKISSSIVNKRAKNHLAESNEAIFPTIFHYLFEDRVTNNLHLGRSALYSSTERKN